MSRQFPSIVAGAFIAALVASACAPAAPATPTPAPAPAAKPTVAPKPAAPAAPTAPAAAPTVAPAPTAKPATAGSYPQNGKTLTMLVGFAAGGSSDVGARLMATGLEKELGINVEVVNKAGAGGQLAYTQLTQSKPDGYTISLTNFPSSVVTYLDPARQASYSRESFQPVALHVVDPGIIAVKADSPWKTVQDVVDAAKANPKKIRVSTTGIQSDEHFAMLQLQKMTGAQFAFVHFSEGIAKAKAAYLGGNVDVLVANVSDASSLVQDGETRVLGVMDSEETPSLPGVKTFEAQGYKLHNSASRGYSAPGGTPKEIVDLLSAAMGRVINSPQHRANAQEGGLQLRYLDAAGYQAYWSEYEAMIRDLLPLSKEQ